MKLLALIFAYIISHFIAKPQRFRCFGWYESWSCWIDKKTNFSLKEVTVILTIAIPVIVLGIILNTVFNNVLGMLIASILVLNYCIGPASLEEDVNSGDIRQRLGVRKNAKISVLIKKMAEVSLQRWFGIFFWYLLLGVIGAFIYRLSERLDFFTKDESNNKQVIVKLMKILNYPVAWVMVVSLAIASDFERIYKKCKPYMNIENINKMDLSFLYEAVDFAVENCEVEDGNNKNIEQVTASVLKRMLIVWLVFVSVLVILAV